jgi:hypothetical protein
MRETLSMCHQLIREGDTLLAWGLICIAMLRYWGDISIRILFAALVLESLDKVHG